MAGWHAGRAVARTFRRAAGRAGMVAAVTAVLLATTALPAQAQPAAMPLSTGAAPEYRLSPGDVVRISVYQNPDLTLETRINEANTVTYPLVGEVAIGGMSVMLAERAIAERLRSGNFVRQPQVNVMVMQVRGNQASVLGQVNRPGRFPIETAELRLSDLIAAAGGVLL